ncbi:MAG: hypothetical protein ACRD2Y_09605 [Terriglobales bacterium]
MNKRGNLRWFGYLAVAWLAASVTAPPVSATEAGKPTAASVQKAKAKSKTRQKKTPGPVPVEAPPAPLLPYQLPAQPPKVMFRDGQLTIVAENATLAAVMEQVRVTTGAAVETGSFFGGERVSVRLGPGAPRDVLADLLNGTNYNYVLLGSLRNSQALVRVIVTQRGAPAPNTAAAPTAPRTFPPTAQQPQPPPDEETELEPETEEAPEVQQQVPAQNEPPSPQANPQATPQPGAPPGTPGQAPQVKTPQELLQELQNRMRRQEEEQNEQQRQQQAEEEPK